ncbi:uncharacterized protein LOC110033137 [Phalaenopsis equestris]|uniref:uncharacterized protein LOC110033137 n=1 Tax=Phalaenopsis equestris TaxID=78828 RepID=UPI0009E58D92|nr:uncharacterized protein LOC110033137 [Phalaenopsis equestris]
MKWRWRKKIPVGVKRVTESSTCTVSTLEERDVGFPNAAIQPLASQLALITTTLSVNSVNSFSSPLRQNINSPIFFLNHNSSCIRIQCRSGMCTTPIQVTASQLVANHVFPQPVVKALLYPGAIVNCIYTNMSLPSWDNILHIYNLININNASAVVDLQRLEVLAGSYFAVAGSLIGILNPGRMSMFGTLLLVWGLVKEGMLGKPATTDPEKRVYVYPTMVVALICAVCSVKSTARKASRSSNAQPIAKPLKSSTKSKLK